MRKRILFVDDDPAMLEMLRRTFRDDVQRWEMLFASDAEAALLLWTVKRFDVVVADMHMPRFDGARLLARIQRSDPTAVRILLTGANDRHTLDEGLCVAHAMFGKPCDVRVLRECIDALVVRLPPPATLFI
jgi:CheY-like chemotaxis protein